MNRMKLLTTKCLCGALAASFVLTIPSTCFAATNPERVNSLLKEIYTENPNLRNKEGHIRNEINNRLKAARERNYSGKVCSNYPIIDNTSNSGEVFSKIYDSNFWGGHESKSGPGSGIKSTEAIRRILPKIFEKYGIKSMLDAPCGDYNWMKMVNKNGIKYIGGDIVPKIIRINNKKFKDANTSFKVIDITSDEIPKVDMIFCRDCLQHLSNENVKKAFKKFKESGSKYLLVTNYAWTLENYDIKDGDFRALNLRQKPFNLNTFIERFKESEGGGNCPDKYLYLYRLEDIDVESMFESNQLPTNIPIAMALDENYVYPTVVSITSVMENSNYKVEYDFHIMHPSNLSGESKKILKSLQEKYDNCKINLIDMKDKYKFAHTDSRITTPAYYRLMLSDILPNLDKVIYIDGDTIVLEDLVDMINIDMDGYCYKGFLDGPHLDSMKRFNVFSDHYICDGVMLLNLEELRKSNAVKKFDAFIAKNNNRLEQHDQTVINVVFADKIGVLPAKFGIWNWLCFVKGRAQSWINGLVCPEKYTSGEMLNASRSPAILHCVSKPWICNCNEFTDIWWRYSEQTDIFDKIKKKYCILDGVYIIASTLDSKKVLDISEASRENGAKLHLWERNNSNAQKFKVTYNKDGYYTIEALCSGKLIDCPRASKKIGTKLWQYEKNNTNAQKWFIVANKDGSHRIISKCNGMSIDVQNASTSIGTPIQCYTQNGTNAQNFRFIKCN